MGSYQVGVDLGTTYTAAAVHRDGETAIFALGGRTAAVPSVVLLRPDGTFLTGEAAERRATSEPDRVVREFKRRFGDTTPIIVGGSPYSAEALTSRLLASVMGQIEAQEGPAPSRIVVTYPANWGNYKRELLDQTVRLAGLDPSVVGFITEPEAAALSYAAQERVEPGEVVAVYDLGGGTFDAAVLQRTTEGFAILGRPEGVERLGGIDFDAAVFAHISASFGDALASIDPEDPTALLAVTRLRQDCVAAKEALSSDADAAIPVVLPTVQTEVRITRQEFERIIRPSLADTIEAMRRAVRSAQLTPEQVSRVLLVGGSSRIPLVAQLVTSELGRPVAVDAHPKHAIALGAAMAAGGVRVDAATPLRPAGPRSVPATPVGPAPGQPVSSPAPGQPVSSPRPVDPPPRLVGAGPTPGFDPNRTVAAPAGSPPTPPRPRPPAKAKPVPLGDLMARGGLTPPGGSGASASPSSSPSPGPRAAVANPAPPQSRPAPPPVSSPDPGSGRTEVLPPDPGSGRTEVLRPDPGSGRTEVLRPDPGSGRTEVLRPDPGSGRTEVLRPGPGGANPPRQSLPGQPPPRQPLQREQSSFRSPPGLEGAAPSFHQPAARPSGVPADPAGRRGGVGRRLGRVLLLLLVVVVVAAAIVGGVLLAERNGLL